MWCIGQRVTIWCRTWHGLPCRTMWYVLIHFGAREPLEVEPSFCYLYIFFSWESLRILYLSYFQQTKLKLFIKFYMKLLTSKSSSFSSSFATLIWLQFQQNKALNMLSWIFKAPTRTAHFSGGANVTVLAKYNIWASKWIYFLSSSEVLIGSMTRT